MVQRCVRVLAALCVGIVAQACAGDEAESATQASSESVGSCAPGVQGCACGYGGACAVGLSCVDDRCIDPDSGGTSGGDSSGDTTGGESSASTSGTGTGSASATAGTATTATTASGGSDSSGDGPCSDNDECAGDEVCVDGDCWSIDAIYFNVVVDLFAPPSCDDGWGDAELYYDYYEGGDYISSSAVSGCPGDWPDEEVIYDPLFSFELEFWESDAIDDDLITSLCWNDGSCTPVPHSILRAGRWVGYDGSGTYYLDLRFEPLLP